MGELGQLFEICAFSRFRTKIQWRALRQRTVDTHVGICTCSCPRVKGTLQEHERTCALNA